jgi:hypothetical protein
VGLAQVCRTFCASVETRFFCAELVGFALPSIPQSIELPGFALLHLLQIDVDIAFDGVNVGVARPKLPRAWTGRRRHAAARGDSQSCHATIPKNGASWKPINVIVLPPLFSRRGICD